MGEVFGLIDCNNFYVSCERSQVVEDIFEGSQQPLEGRSGCIVPTCVVVSAQGLEMDGRRHLPAG